MGLIQRLRDVKSVLQARATEYEAMIAAHDDKEKEHEEMLDAIVDEIKEIDDLDIL